MLTQFASAQTGGPICTQIGCDSRVYLFVEKQPPGTKHLVFCVEGACRPARNQKPVGASLPCPATDSVSVVVVAKDANKKRIVRLTRTVPVKVSQPNGPSCPPTCHQASVILDGRQLRPG